MTLTDYLIVCGYFGVLHQKKASVDVRSYFLGGNKISYKKLV